ncbi:MAG: hypothetical protein CTY21_12760 [Methylomonas sp.]|nr:MAG: hypothetical protein CTY21_12760 [Methylomonas sp.]
MNAFNLLLLSPGQTRLIAGVASFIGEDASGSFGIQANHGRFITWLVFGLARFKQPDAAWQYLALPGAAATFENNTLTLNTRYFLLDPDCGKISAQLDQRYAEEQEALRASQESVQRMELTMLKRLKELKTKSRWQS